MGQRQASPRGCLIRLPLILLLALLVPLLGCQFQPYPWDRDPLVQFVQEEHKRHFKQDLPRWEAWKIVHAARTFAPPERVVLVLACGAEESHFKLGEVVDDGKSLGIYQVQHRYHRHASKELLRHSITANTRCAVEHLRGVGWSTQAYNAGIEGAKKGRGKNHARKVARTQERMAQFLASQEKP